MNHTIGNLQYLPHHYHLNVVARSDVFAKASKNTLLVLLSKPVAPLNEPQVHL